MPDSLAFYQLFNLYFLYGSLLLCLLAVCGGALYHRLRKQALLPPVPMFPGSSFPTIWDSLFTFFFLAMIVMITAVDHISQPPEDDTTRYGLSLTAVVFNLLIYLPMLIRFGLLPRPATTGHTGVKSIIGLAFITVFGVQIFAMAYELSGVLDAITSFFQCPKFQAPVMIFLKGDTYSTVMLIIAAVAIAPIGEECCYRGFLFNCLKKHTHTAVAAVLSSMLFAAVHMSVAQLLPLFLFAILQCVIYTRSKSLVAPIVAHAIFNAVSIGIIYLFPPPL